MRTVGWRSPLGGPQYDGPIPRDSEDTWPQERIDSELEERERAAAVADPGNDNAELVTDGGEDRDNAHAARTAEQLSMADREGVERSSLSIGDHVTDLVDPEQDATMVVVGLPSVRAAACKMDGGPLTVADVNPDRMAEDLVVEVAFSSRTDTDLDEAKRFSYPRGRLHLETPIHGEEGE